MEVIYGMHAVEEAVKAGGRVQYVAISRERSDPKVQRIIALCKEVGVPVRYVSRDEVHKMAKTSTHQGIAAVAGSKQYTDLDVLLENKRARWSFLLLLDGIEDPHNLGALMRTADGAGVDGIVIPERRAVGVTGTVAKAAAGAAEHVPVSRVTNISRTLEELKDRNIWVVGLDERGDKFYDEVDYKMDCAVVMGAEGKGLHEHVRRKCDFLVKIPMAGEVPSLNVSVAGAVVMYEISRQRR
jgi:23S rRNA (guanosine2251-2'-O)-methyltransferase